MKLSASQLKRLRRARGHLLFTADVNRGNARRTYAWLFARGLLDWDPIYKGRVVVTASGENVLKEARERELAAMPPLVRDALRRRLSARELE